ncbi:anti-sigma factor [Acidisoma cellulosilytica]|uniref:Anti-sigma factor n=1 Tax=Acidisoma cellulosilyticum TaxID=2802395 RepID=A0A964E6B9_9PROT|nr:anti-sigma factor [Acidisoma cellulosilyticum]MCB8883337.1 anti-sigma factor [Acidisoma cellulosilyticum]
MSGFQDDDRNLLAAEYVLGVLDGAEREAVQRRADEDSVLNDAITEWENRLSPLAAMVSPLAPPAGLWPRVAASCGISPLADQAPAVAPRAAVHTRARLLRRLDFWRTTTALGFGLAAALAIVVVVRNSALQTPAPNVPLAAAVLVAPNGGAPTWLASAGPDNSVQFKPLQHIAVASGKDLELWGLPDGEKVPRPLGLITADGRTITLPNTVKAPMEIMVSLEQKGGSPTGLPQGPVLWLGHMAAYAATGNG